MPTVHFDAPSPLAERPLSLDKGGAVQLQEFRALADLLPEVVWTADAKGSLNYVSAWWSSITDVRPWLGGQFEQWAHIVHAEDLTALQMVWKQARLNGQPFTIQMRLRRHRQDGQWRWFATQGSAERDEQGVIRGWIGTVVEITNLKRAEGQAAQAAARLQLMVSQVPLILMTTDADGVYTFAIGKGLAALGVTSESIVGHSVLERQKSAPHSYAAIKRVLAGEDVTWEHISYGRCWESHGVPVRDLDGQLAGMASISFDVTERKDADRLATSEQVARDAAQLKSHFLATMSHEIRTPLGGILGIAQMLDETAPAEQTRALVDMLQTSGKSLLRIVDEILDYSKLEAGRVTLNMAPFALRRFLASQLERVASAAASRNLALHLEVCSTLGDVYLGDVQHIGVVLNHFLSNAIKFTQQGQIVLSCAPIAASHQHAQEEPKEALAGFAQTVRFSVSDTGMGIDPAIQGSLFQPFIQADLSHSRHFGGAGLGLSICRGLADLMQGQVTFRSALGEGTTVHLDLPLSIAQLAAASGLPAVGHAAHTGHILVADDSVVSQTIVRAALEKLGHRVTTVSDGQAAIDALLKDDYDLVMLDCQMPILDGCETARRIRSAPSQTHVGHLPILALTASSLPEDDARCRAAGMDALLTKPFDDAQIQRLLAPWFAP